MASHTDHRPIDDPPIRIGRRFQGPTDSGQGGWTAERFAARIGQPVTIAMRAPIPLETDLFVHHDDDAGAWRLVAETGDAIMVAERSTERFADTEPVTIEAAAEARTRFPGVGADHPVPFCFSCGIQHDSMNVHAGPLGDDRFATDWRVPEWAVDEAGAVDPGALWAAIDCTAAWWVGFSRDHRVALTAQYAVEILHPIEPGETYALVGWSGDHDPEWDGRKRHAASAAFAPDGTCVARSTSFWISIAR